MLQEESEKYNILFKIVMLNNLPNTTQNNPTSDTNVTLSKIASGVLYRTGFT